MINLDRLKDIIVICDMDDVMTHDGFLYLINEYMGTHYVLSDFKDYYMQNVIPIEQRPDFFKFFFTKNLYDYCTIAPECYRVLALINKYYDLCIGTSYIYPDMVRESGIIAKYKHEFLLDKFPFLTYNNIGLVNQKRFFKDGIRIDDAMKNLFGDRIDGVIKFLYTTYHNQLITKEELDSKGIERVNDWLEIKDRLIDGKELIYKRIFTTNNNQNNKFMLY